MSDTNLAKLSHFGKAFARGGVFSLKRVVAVLLISALMGSIKVSITLQATIVGSGAPVTVDIRLHKEIDMKTNSLSKLPFDRVSGSRNRAQAPAGKKKGETNLAKQSHFGKALQEEVYSLKRVVAVLLISALMGSIKVSITLQRPHYLLLIKSGAV